MNRKLHNWKKGLAAVLACTVLVSSLPVSAVSAAQGASEDPFIATPYTKEDGSLAEGLEQAVLGKHHWLETTEPLPVTVNENIEAGTLTIGNGVIERQFKIPAVGGTEFYTKSYKNLYIDKELLKDEAKPDVYLGLYDKPYEEVYSDAGVKVVNDPKESSRTTIEIPDGAIKFTPDYYFIGGTSAQNAFVFDGYTVSGCEKPFEWQPSDTYGDPAAEDWPPKGKHIEFSFSAPETFPEVYRGIKVKVIYEMYDNLSSMKKRVEITNTGEQQIMIGRLAPEVLNGNADLDELLTMETSYTCGDQSTLPINMDLPCKCDEEKVGSPFAELNGIKHSCYAVGPAYELTTGQTFAAFDTYELIHSTYWFELKMREHLGMYRKLFPWITDNPLTMHNTGSLTKAVIDHAASAGFEMIIQSYSAPDSSAQMLTRNQAQLDNYKALVEYAHTKGVDIGIYQAQYTRDQYKGGAAYGTNGVGQWNTWCQASAAFDDYWDNFKNFVQYTGLDCVEIDGPYPGCYCNNGEKHVNADKETDPDPDGTDKETGDASKYAVHKGYFDSQTKQWENSVRMLCKEFRDMGVYIKVPGWYYINGGNKCGIGYEEVAWSQPRQEQLLYGRQLMHNASYARTMSMSWSHIPFAQYQGGGSAAMFQPFKDHMEDYNWVIAQNLGNGVTSDFRGPALYDNETLPILQKWVNFYQRYRGIVNSDMVHIAQAAYDSEGKDRTRGVKMDTLYHVNANNPGEKGLLWVYNQTNEPRTETITVPMYYTGLTNLNYPPVPLKDSLGKDVHAYGIYPPNYDWLPKSESNYRMPDATGQAAGIASFVREGVDVQDLSIDSNGNAHITVTLQPMSFTYYAVYPEGEQPEVTIQVGQVKDVEQKEVSEHSASLSWNKDVALTITEDGVVNENPTIGIDSFNIYRDGVLIGKSMTNSFTDTDLKENTSYQYTVEAVASGVAGAKSEALTVVTKADTVKPAIAKVSVKNASSIVVTFTEPVDQTTAEMAENYSLSGGKQVRSAKLTSEKEVTLTVDTLEALTTYELTAENVKDISEAGNVMDSAKKDVVYGYLAKYSMDNAQSGNLADSFENHSGKAYQVQDAQLDYGKAAKFDAAKTAYADLGTGLFNGLSTYSVSMWVNPSGSGKQVLLSQGQEGMPANDFTLSLEGSTLTFRQSTANETAVELVSSKAVEAGVWSLITLVREGDTFRLYVNQEEAAVQTVSGIGNADSQNALLLGAMKNNAGGDRTCFYTGLLDEVSLYQVSLTKEQIGDLYASNAVNFGAQLSAAKALSSRYFTEASFTALQQAITALEEKLTGGAMVPAEVLQAAENLKIALNGLEKKDEYKSLATYYSMNEAQGPVVLDSVSGQNGELTNGDYLRMGTPFGKGLYFTNHRADYMTIPASPTAGSTDYTVSGWFKSQLRIDTDLQKAGRQVLLADGGQVALSLTDNTLALELNNGQESKTLTANKKIAYDTVTGGEVRQAWNYFAVVKQGDAYTLYLNGEAVAQETFVGANWSGALTVGIQKTADGSQSQYNGLMDELAFYTEALSAQAVSAAAKEISFNKGSKTNIALNKTLMSDNMDDAFRINDGKVLDFASPDTPWTARGKGTVGDSGLKYGFDLGAVYEINALSLTEFFRNYGNEQIRRFRDVVIQISTTADFSSNVTTVFNTDTDNSMGYGKGTDSTYYSFELGYDIVLDTPVRGRYVRLINSGFVDQTGGYQAYSNVSELEVYGELPQPSKPKLELSRDEVTLFVAGDREFVQVNPDIDTSSANVTAVSDQETVATVLNKNGILQITAVGEGTATITVTHPRDNTLTKQIKVTVKGLTPKAVVDDSDASIKYEGNVSVYDSGRGPDPDGVYEYNKGIHYLRDAGSLAQYTFTGTGIEVITTVNVDQGRMEVFIDGISQGIMETKTPNVNYPKRANQMCVFSKTDLPYGEHTIKIVNLEGNMTIDAFRVYEVLPLSDKSELQKLVDSLASLEEASYTPASWAVYAEKLAAAQVVLADAGATQEQVNAAHDALKAAAQALKEKADKTELNELVAQCLALQQADYTAESWALLQKALADIQPVLEDDNAEASAVRAAFNSLLAARLGLQEVQHADKKELNALIKQAKEYDLSNCRPGKVQAFEIALAKAEEVAADPKATQADVNKASDALLEAIVNLKEIVDRSDLTNLMEILSGLNGEDYTAASFAVLTQALENAAKINDDSSVKEVNDAYRALQQAYLQLERVEPAPDKSALANAIKNAELILSNIDSFKPATVAGLDKILEQAKAVYDNPDATLAEVEQAVNDLTAANAKAQVKEDKEILFTAMEKAEALNASDYTAESFGILTQALSVARLVIADGDATREQVEQAAAAIESALANLVKASGSTEDPSEPSSSEEENPGSSSGTGSENAGGTPTQTGDSAAWPLIAAGVAAMAAAAFLLFGKRVKE